MYNHQVKYTGTPSEVNEQFLKAIKSKHLRAVCFDTRTSNDTAGIRLILKIDTDFGSSDFTVELPCNAKIDNYTEGWIDIKDTDIVCYEHCGIYPDSETPDNTLTFLQSLKLGDFITLHWTTYGGGGEKAGGYINGATCSVRDYKDTYYVAQDATLFNDTLKVDVYRNNRKPNRRADCYFIGQSNCPDNTAKMIRRDWN